MASAVEKSKYTADDVMQLWDEYKRTNDNEIRNELVMHYMSLVKKIAFKTYRNAWFLDCADELVNEGVIAMINAIDRFDISQNIKFETFASRRIQGAMLDYIHKQSGFVRKIHEMSTMVNDARQRCCERLGQPPTNEELAEELNISLDELYNILQQIQPIKVMSINQPDSSNPDDEKILDISTGNEYDPIEILSKKEYNEELVKGIKKLSEQQQLVLALFYQEEFSVREIASTLNLSVEKVSQIRFQAIKKLKKLVSDKISI